MERAWHQLRAQSTGVLRTVENAGHAQIVSRAQPASETALGAEP